MKGVAPAGISRPNLGIGMDARIGMFDSKIRITAGKKVGLNSSIFPTLSIIKRSVPSFT
jgi:hypothetical protein